MNRLAQSFVIVSVWISTTVATIIHVPADIDSIQGGINIANPGDTVLVQRNTYLENIDFLGKNIPPRTFIQGF